MSNIYDTANQIERELRELDEFKALQAAYEEVKADEAAHCLKNSKDSNKDYKKNKCAAKNSRMKMLKSTKHCNESARNSSYQRINAKEQAFSLVVNDLNRIIMTPVRDMYND